MVAGRSKEYAEEIVVLTFTLATPIEAVGILARRHVESAVGVGEGDVAGAVVVGGAIGVGDVECHTVSSAGESGSTEIPLVDFGAVFKIPGKAFCTGKVADVWVTVDRRAGQSAEGA